MKGQFLLSPSRTIIVLSIAVLASLVLFNPMWLPVRFIEAEFDDCAFIPNQDQYEPGLDGTGDGCEPNVETLSPINIPIEQGTGVVAAGTGLFGGVGVISPNSITVDVPTGAQVKQVLLYWAGIANISGAPTTTIEVNTIPVTGQIIGKSAQIPIGQIMRQNVTYRADITSLGLVSDGTSILYISGSPYVDQTNQGAGVIVVFDNGSDTTSIDIRDGNDFAIRGRPSPLDTTVPQTFLFEPTEEDRIANLSLFVADGEPDRNSTIRVSIGGDTHEFADLLVGKDGNFWDALTLPVQIQAGTDSLTVEIISEGSHPSSLSWIAAVVHDLSLPRSIWQIGAFDGTRNEFFPPRTHDREFVCDALVTGGLGTESKFIVGTTPISMFPAEIRSSDAPTDDFRYTRSCNSVTIEFETTESHSNVNLVYRRMGGERDIILFDGVEIGSAGPQGRDPFQSTEYLVPVGDLEAGTHTIQIIGQERPECTSGGRCIEGKADGYHWVDGLLLSGETE